MSNLPASVSQKIVSLIAAELTVQPRQVAAAVALLDEGATVPFIARYRKEVTDNLDDTQLRTLEERLLYLRDMEDRRLAILASIEEQGKLTPELRTAIEAAETKQALEDLYLPYKPKRRTRAQIARECGLEPLAQALLADPTLDPQAEAAKYVNGNPTADGGVPDVKAALDGARDILSEQFGETAELLGKLREHLWNNGVVSSTVMDGKETAEEEKFRDYYQYSETIRTVPSHRALALFRGRNAGVLMVKLGLGEEQDAMVPHPCEGMIARHVGIQNQGRPADKWLGDVCRWCWRVKVQPHLETELLTQLRETAESEAIRVFGRNLHELLLAAPAGPKSVMGVDPGIRTGCKVAVVDATGKLLETATIYPHEPRRDWNGSLATLARLAKQHGVALVSIGNGTASRETDKLVQDSCASARPQADQDRRQRSRCVGVLGVGTGGKGIPRTGRVVARRGVDRAPPAGPAGRTREDRPEVDRRGPVPARREPARAGPHAGRRGRRLRECRGRGREYRVGAAARARIRPEHGAGTQYRRVPRCQRRLRQPRYAEEGAAPGRQNLRAGCRLPARQQRRQPAGPLVGPPGSYPVVKRILDHIKKGLPDVMGNREALRGLSPAQFTDESFGLPTVRDILAELEKPGRDPRPEFKTATFQDGVEDVKDLQPGMVLEGVVTNVAAFGAFVDIGVHQDGLVHISALSNKFVKDAHEVVKAGQIVKVKVMEVDVKRNRIGLSMRLDDEPGQSSSRPSGDRGGQRPLPAARASATAVAAARRNLPAPWPRPSPSSSAERPALRPLENARAAAAARGVSLLRAAAEDANRQSLAAVGAVGEHDPQPMQTGDPLRNRNTQPMPLLALPPAAEEAITSRASTSGDTPGPSSQTTMASARKSMVTIAPAGL